MNFVVEKKKFVPRRRCSVCNEFTEFSSMFIVHRGEGKWNLCTKCAGSEAEAVRLIQSL